MQGVEVAVGEFPILAFKNGVGLRSVLAGIFGFDVERSVGRGLIRLKFRVLILSGRFVHGVFAGRLKRQGCGQPSAESWRWHPHPFTLREVEVF